MVACLNPECGKPFTPKKYAFSQKYCSDKCCQAHGWQRRKKKRRSSPKMVLESEGQKFNVLPIRTLKEAIDYHPDTGRMFWMVERRSGKHKTVVCARPGDEIRNVTAKGYLVVVFDGVRIPAHRVAYALYHGRWPSGFIDHINCKKDDNRIENLRDATRSQNGGNLRAPRTNTTGFKGVSKIASGRFKASITENGQSRQIGIFDTAEEAASAYRGEATRIFGEFARTS